MPKIRKNCNAVYAADATQKGDRKRKIASGAGVLAIGSVIAKMLGALYRIPLTNILGAQGMGMYQLVFPVYALFMVLSTAGIPTALSRIVAEKRAIGQSSKNILPQLCSLLPCLAEYLPFLLLLLQRFLPYGRAIPIRITVFS